MAQRISDLTPLVGSLDPSSQLEVAVPTSESPTGYTTRRVSASALGGSDPYRIPFEYKGPTNDFVVSIPKSMFDGSAVRPSSATDPLSNWDLAGMVIQVNAIGRVVLSSEAPDQYDGLAFCNSGFLFNQIDFNDSSALRNNSFGQYQDGEIFKTTQGSYPPNSTFYHTYPVYLTNVTQDGGTSSSGNINFRFDIQNTYDAGPFPELIHIRGYLDVTTLFGPYIIPA